MAAAEDSTGFAEIDVTAWTPVNPEYLGTKPKEWLVEPDNEQLWLFKHTTSNARSDGSSYRKGDDWAERVATALCQELGVHAARTELAFRVNDDGSVTYGVVSRKMLLDDEDLITGNELLADVGVVAATPKDREGYTPEAIRRSLEGVEPPADDSLGFSAWEHLVGYLFLDALIANVDRHQENWAVTRTGRTRRLAPSFDHGSSLGYQLDDRDRLRRLATSDSGQSVEAWASRARSRFEGAPHPRVVLEEAFRLSRPQVRDHWIRRCESVVSLEPFLRQVPEERMPPGAREFAARLYATNRSYWL